MSTDVTGMGADETPPAGKHDERQHPYTQPTADHMTGGVGPSGDGRSTAYTQPAADPLMSRTPNPGNTAGRIIKAGFRGAALYVGVSVLVFVLVLVSGCLYGLMSGGGVSGRNAPVTNPGVPAIQGPTADPGTNAGVQPPTTAPGTLPDHDARMHAWDYAFPVEYAAQDRYSFAPRPEEMTLEQVRLYVNKWLQHGCRADPVSSPEVGVYAVLGKGLTNEQLELLRPKQLGLGIGCAELDAPGVMALTSVGKEGMSYWTYTWTGWIITTDGKRRPGTAKLHFEAYPEDPSGRGHITIFDLTLDNSPQ